MLPMHTGDQKCESSLQHILMIECTEVSKTPITRGTNNVSDLEHVAEY